jgi:hypothetical protein
MDEATAIRIFDAAVAELNDALPGLNAQRDAQYCSGFDTTSMDLAIIARNQSFLDQIAPLEPVAHSLAAQGMPRLNQSLLAWKQDSVNAIGIIQNMIQARGVTAAKIQDIQRQSWQDGLVAMGRMNEVRREAYGMAKKK